MIGTKSDIVEWQKANLLALRRRGFTDSAIKDVTVVAYYFRREDELDSHFWRTEFAFLKTFETQGLLPSVLVVNKLTPAIDVFCARYSIAVQIAENLVPGKVASLALDLVKNLHKRFDTPYVLIIQDDGFPLRSGLSDFVGRYDYIGAPWVYHATYYDLYPHKYCVGNGGFSLRSKRLCETASAYHRKYFRWVPYWWYLLGDDTFYCKTLRFWFPRFRRMFRWASRDEAAMFSVESDIGFTFGENKPLGFHGTEGWINWNRKSGRP